MNVKGSAVSGVAFEFVTVSVPTEVPPDKILLGENTKAIVGGTGAGMPVPPKLTACGLPAALLVIVNVAVFAPTAVGLKTNTKLQLPEGGTGAPVLQVGVDVKCVGSTPPRTNEVKTRSALPVLLTTTVCDVLDVATICEPKLIDVGESPITGAGAGAITRVTACVASGVLPFNATSVNVDVPAVVGVPEITPDAALSVRPAGSEPAITLQVGVGDPVAVAVWL